MFLLYLIFLASMAFSWRAVSSSSIALILISGLIINKQTTGDFLNPRLKNIFLLSCAIFFFIQALGILYTHNSQEQLRDIRGKSILLVVPLAVCSCNFIDRFTANLILKAWALVLTIAGSICLAVAAVRYSHDHNTGHFFYYRLVSPFQHHPVQFSIFILTALIFLFESGSKKDWLIGRFFHFSVAVFLSIFLFLLSSKLILVLYIIYIIYFLAMMPASSSAHAWIRNGVVLGVTMVVVFVFSYANPVTARFREIFRGGLGIVEQNRFEQGDYFNGLQFRLLQWRFVPAILNERGAWWTGVTAGDAQQELNAQYISRNMYTGKPSRGDKGFIGYNAHDEFLEALLQSGIPGLLAFIFVCISLVVLAAKKKSRELSFMVLIVLTYCFSESVLESQYNLFLFTFFPLFFYLGEKETYEKRRE